jgi:hypothetical protein
MPISPQRILVLYRHSLPGEMLSSVRHHLQSLKYSEVKHELFYFNCLIGAPAWLKYFHFDAIVLHTTFLSIRWSNVFQYWKWQLQWIKDAKCVKIAIPQDEYDYSEILDQWLFEWNVSTILTNFDQEQRESLYPKMHKVGVFYKCLTGYIDEETAKEYANKVYLIADRPYDIVYRAKNLPYKFGSHGQLKHKIGVIIKERAKYFQLKLNISTSDKDTILGDKWFDFLAAGKTIIGCESGSSVLDKKGEISHKIQQILSKDEFLTFDEVSISLPDGWDNYKFFAISPRHFEAVITKTCQILVTGNYDGVLEPNRHYIPLKKDFSNLDEILEKIQDIAYITSIAECAYKEIYLSGKYTYKIFAKIIETAIEAHGNKKLNRNLINNEIFTKISLLPVLLMFSEFIDYILYKRIYLFCKKIFFLIKNILNYLRM